MAPLALFLTLAAADPTNELLRVKDFVIGAGFVQTEVHPGHPFMQKTSRDTTCSVSFGRDLNDDPTPNYTLSVRAKREGSEESVNILAYHYDGRDLVVRRVGNAWPPKETPHVEHFLATTKRGRILTVEWSSGFYGEKAWLKLELDRVGHLRYAYAKTKTHGGHLMFPIRDVHEAECDFD